MSAAPPDTPFLPDQPELRWKSKFCEKSLGRAAESSLCATLKEAFEIIDRRKGMILLVTRMPRGWAVFTYKGKLLCKVDFDKILLGGLPLGGNPLNPNTYIVNGRGNVARIVRIEDHYRLDENACPTEEPTGPWVPVFVPTEEHNDDLNLVWLPRFAFRPDELQSMLVGIDHDNIDKKKIVVDFMKENARTWDEEHEQKMSFKMYSNFTVLAATADDIKKTEESFNEQVPVPGTDLADFGVTNIPLREISEYEKGKIFIITYPSAPGIFNFVFGGDETNDIGAAMIGRSYRMNDVWDPEVIFSHNI
jgi:hypothetical protein